MKTTLPDLTPELAADGGLPTTACCAPLDVWDSLLVRACKCNNPTLGRFRRIMARRCALRLEHIEDTYVARRLLQIVREHNLTTLEDFVMDLNPTQLWKCGAPKGCKCDANGIPYSHREKVITLAAAILRLTAVAKLPGLRSPSRFSRSRHNAEPIRGSERNENHE